MIQRLTRFVALLCFVVPGSRAAAHSNLSEYVQHDVTLEAGDVYLDLTVQLTFFDDQAERQRRALDSDGDGSFSTSEHAAFQKTLLAEADTKLALQSGDTSLELVPRYDPEIQCVASASGEGAHLRFEVRLHYFVRRPDALQEGAELEVHDGLYPEIPAMAALRVTAKEGCRISVGNGGRERGRSADSPGPLVFEARLGAAVAPVKVGGETSKRSKQGE